MNCAKRRNDPAASRGCVVAFKKKGNEKKERERKRKRKGKELRETKHPRVENDPTTKTSKEKGCLATVIPSSINRVKSNQVKSKWTYAISLQQLETSKAGKPPHVGMAFASLGKVYELFTRVELFRSTARSVYRMYISLSLIVSKELERTRILLMLMEMGIGVVVVYGRGYSCSLIDVRADISTR